MRAAGLECKTIIKRRAGRELLSVLRMIRPAVTAGSLATPSARTTALPRQDGKAVAPSPGDGEYGGLLDAYM